MSAWPESVYIINKLNYSLDAVFDIDRNGIQNINNLNARIDDLNNQINGENPEGISPRLTRIQSLLGELETQIAGFQELYDEVVERLDQFEEDLSEANHRIVYIGTQTEIEELISVSEYSVALII